MKNQPLVSIILPTYNRDKHIERAIKSVLNQSYQNMELIIVDENSTDNTPKIVSELQKQDSRIIFSKNETKLGFVKSLNKGLKIAQGKYIARIDDDDEWIDEDKIRKQVDFLNNNQDYVLVGTGVVFINESDKEMLRFLNPQSDAEIRRRLLGKNCFIHSSVMFRKKAALHFGGYNESMETCEDYDLWLKLGTIGGLANLPIYGVNFTVTSSGLSAQKKLELIKRNIYLTKEYRDIYPNYFLSLLRGYARLLIYGYLRLDSVRKISAYFKK